MTYVEGARGLRLHVHCSGSATGDTPTALLLHGFLDSGATWAEVAARLCEEGFQVLAPDLRGFGASDRIGRGGYYHFPDYVADVAAIVDTFTPKKLLLVGHSMGGTIAALYAGARPERVDSLALLEGLGPLASPPERAVERMRTWLNELERGPPKARPIASMEEAAARLHAHHTGVSPGVIASRAELLTAQDEAGKLWWASDPLHRTTSPTPFNDAAFRAFLAEIRCPTLFVSGGPTGWHPPDEDDRLACIEGAIRVELDGAGHMMHWTAPRELADTLVAFFRGRNGTGSKSGA